MNATDVLTEEHQIILRVIAALGKAGYALEHGQPVRPGFFLEAADFIREFADGCHHQKEEGVLFPALEARQSPTQNELIARLRSEHVRGRIYARSLREAARRLERGDGTARAQLINSARGYAQLLWLHVDKEETVAFPTANEILPAEQRNQLAERFQRLKSEEIASGFQEKYLNLASALEAEANGWLVQVT